MSTPPGSSRACGPDPLRGTRGSYLLGSLTLTVLLPMNLYCMFQLVDAAVELRKKHGFKAVRRCFALGRRPVDAGMLAC